ncbi:Solute carrier family 25 member 45 [Lamellibrachia satsuma]|nr:Solute carrier family 25 member 45 [Lamellibrachia satsuma]
MSIAYFEENVCHFTAGMLGGMAGLLCGYPADTIKVRQQTGERMPMAQCVRDTLKHEGTHGLFKGMSFPLFAVGVINSTFFGVYGSTTQFVQVLRTTNSKPPPPTSYLDMVLVGGFAGVVQSIPCTPIELIKVRLQVQRESPEMFAHLYKGPTHCLRCIVRDNGVRGPFKALGLTAVRDCLSFAIFVSGYQYICDLLTPNYEVNEPSTGVMLFAGGVVGMASWYIMPLDTIKTRMQADSFSEPRYHNWRCCAREIYSEGGCRAFWRGLPVTMVRAFPLNAVMFFVYERTLTFMKRILHIDKHHVDN